MTEQERCLWAQAQTDYSQSLAVALKVWGDTGKKDVPYEVFQAAAATVLIHLTKLREGSHRAVVQPQAAPPAVKREGTTTPSQAAVAVPPCPSCGGETWDNRPKKQSGEYKPNSADFTCKDKTCKTQGKDGKFYRTGVWVKDLKPSPVMQQALATTRTLAEVPVALDDDGDDGLPF